MFIHFPVCYIAFCRWVEYSIVFLYLKYQFNKAVDDLCQFVELLKVSKLSMYVVSIYFMTEYIVTLMEDRGIQYNVRGINSVMTHISITSPYVQYWG